MLNPRGDEERPLNLGLHGELAQALIHTKWLCPVGKSLGGSRVGIKNPAVLLRSNKKHILGLARCQNLALIDRS